MVGPSRSKVNMNMPNSVIWFSWLSHNPWMSLLFIICCVLSLYLGRTLTLQPTTNYLKDTRAPAKIQIRVLCFGASITAGWTAGGRHHYPYATRLSSRLADELPTSHFSIDVDGSPGDTVIHGQYMDRMKKDMEIAKVPYDWVM